MSFPAKPRTPYGYVDYQTSSPSDPLPATEVAADFNSHKASIDAVIDFQQLIQRSDGRLNNGSVRPETLSSGTVALIGKWTPRGAWLTATAYALNDLVTESNDLYVRIEAHTSGVFAADLAAGKWMLLDGDTARVGADNVFTGTNEFDGTTNFDGAVDFDGAEDHSGTEMHSGTVNFDGPVDMDGTVDMTGSSSVTVPTAATTPVVAGHNSTAASTAFVQTILAATKPVGGLLWSVNVSDATNDIDISVGAMADTAGTFILRLASAITKRLDAAWAVGTNQGGLDTGAVGNNEYYGWLIGRSDTGVVDYLWSLSATAPTMPTNYDFKAGPCAWVKRLAGANVAWKTYELPGGGVELLWVTPRGDISLNNTLTTVRRTDPLSVPKNFSVVARLRTFVYDAGSSAGFIITNPDEVDAAPNGTTAPLRTGLSITSLQSVPELEIRTSATGTIASRAELATVDNFEVTTLGFKWSRRP